MSWDNDHSVIVNWHKGNIHVYSPKDEDAFRHIKDGIMGQLDDIYQYLGTDGYDPECRDVEKIVSDALELYFSAQKTFAVKGRISNNNTTK